MNEGADWLPGLEIFNGKREEWEDFLDRMYVIFRRDFVEREIRCLGKPIRIDANKRDGEKEESFWHIICEEDSKTGLRITPCPDRYRRIRWPRAVIESVDDPQRTIHWRSFFSGKRKKECRLKIATPGFSYIVILAERRDYYFLRTAYPTTWKNSRQRIVADWKNPVVCP